MNNLRKRTSKKTTRKRVVGGKRQKYKHSRPGYLSPLYQAFVKCVRDRDQERCQYPNCKRRKYGIEVHHILRYADYPHLRYNPDFALCLCEYHHKKVTGQEMAWAPLFLQIVQMNKLKQEARNG